MRHVPCTRHLHALPRGRRDGGRGVTPEQIHRARMDLEQARKNVGGLDIDTPQHRCIEHLGAVLDVLGEYEEMRGLISAVLAPYCHAQEYGTHKGWMRWLESHRGKVETERELHRKAIRERDAEIARLKEEVADLLAMADADQSTLTQALRDLGKAKVAFEPVKDWYDGEGRRSFPEMVATAVMDLQADRRENAKLKEMLQVSERQTKTEAENLDKTIRDLEKSNAEIAKLREAHGAVADRRAAEIVDLLACSDEAQSMWTQAIREIGKLRDLLRDIEPEIARAWRHFYGERAGTGNDVLARLRAALAGTEDIREEEKETT